VTQRAPRYDVRCPTRDIGYVQYGTIREYLWRGEEEYKQERNAIVQADRAENKKIATAHCGAYMGQLRA